MANILIKQDTVDLKTNSVVKEVVLYFNKAQVTRSRQVDLTEGENTIAFNNLGHRVDESSIKARFHCRDAAITSTSLVQNQLYFFKEALDEAKYQSILDGYKKLITIMDNKTVLAMENRIIRDLREYIRQALNEIMLEQEIPIAKLKNALSLLETKMEQTGAEILDLNEEIRIWTERIALLKEELDRIRLLDKREQNNIEIVIQADKACTLELEVAYILPGVQWKTSYDAKLDNQKQVLFACYGEVRQTTGEHWENARLVLSTAETTRSMEIPPVYPLYLSGYEQKRDKTLVIQRVNAKEESPDLLPEREEGGEKDAEPEPEAAEKTITIGKKGTAYTFQVLKPYTIPADGFWHRVLILETLLEADTVYETIPEALEYIYLKANFKNTTGIPLLAGRVAVYRNESYMGKSGLTYTAPQEPFSLSFGIDDDLKVKRMQVYKGTDQKKLLTKNERYWSYRFILYNYKDTQQKVILKEAIYHSRLKEVEVEIQNSTTPGYTQSEDSVLTWEIILPPDPFKYTTVELDYKIAAPKAFHIDAL